MNGIITCAVKDYVGSGLLALQMCIFFPFDISIIFLCLILKPCRDQDTFLLNIVSDTAAQRIHFKI